MSAGSHLLNPFNSERAKFFLASLDTCLTLAAAREALTGPGGSALRADGRRFVPPWGGAQGRASRAPVGVPGRRFAPTCFADLNSAISGILRI